MIISLPLAVQFTVSLQCIVHASECHGPEALIDVNENAAHPGGRHSNDHADFRAVAIAPAADEV